MKRQLKNIRRRANRHPDPEATLRRWLAMASTINHAEGWADISEPDWQTIIGAPVPPPLIPRPADLPGDIWGVTCHFNPAGFAIKKQVYDQFRAATRAQGLKLLAVELSPSGIFELADDDADIVLRLTEGDTLWQKERLLNIGIAALPPEVDKVIWIDADVVFDNDQWVAQTAKRLEQFPIVQCFHDCIRLGKATDLSAIMQAKKNVRPGMGEERRQYGFVAAHRQNVKKVGHPGFAWAARRSLLEKHGLYDVNVVGCGDAVMACALKREMYVTEDMRSPAYEAHARGWMNRFADDVEHSASFIDGTVFHLWHGNARFRGYGDRTHRFGKTAFDPDRDLHLTSQGTWAWNEGVSANTRRTVARYFRSRREDGGPVVFPTWLLAHPRCGSNWLCSMLNASSGGEAFVPQLVEWHNPAVETKWGLTRPPEYPFVRNTKLQAVHHRGFDLVDVVKRMPDVTFIMLRRRDVIAAATSLYIVRETGETWMLMTEDERKEWLDKQVVIDDTRLLAAHKEILRDVRYWPRKLRAAGIVPAMTVYYEDLLADPSGTLEAVCKVLSPGGDITPVVTDANAPMRQTRPESEAVYERLRELLDARGENL